MRMAVGGDRVPCMAWAPDATWHYRTKIDGRPERCWYQGPPMKARQELFWEIEPLPAPVPDERQLFELRFKGE